MKKTKQSVLVLFVITGLMQCAAQAQESLSEIEQVTQITPSLKGPTDSAELEAFLDGIMAAHLESYHIAGATLAVVKDGEIFFAKGYGYADIKNRKAVDPDKTLFRVGSVSKLITWTAVMQLVEQGKINLNTDVNTYLREFKIPDTYPESITMKHLLTHTPGLENVVRIAARSAQELVPLGEFLAKKMPARVLPPGKLTGYSNYGASLAGYIVEEVSRMSFEDYIEEKIFVPLGMQQSTFRQPLPSHLADNMSAGYIYKDDVFKAEDFEFLNGIAPAGSMSTTATDMAKFMIAHLQHGKYGENRILKEETARLMHTQLFTHDSRVDGNAYGFWERSLNNLRIIGHSGDTVWFHTLLTLIPEKNIGFFVSYNSGTLSTVLARDELLQAFLDRYYPMPEAPDLKPSPDFNKRANRFTGSYGSAGGVSTTYEKLMTLMMVVKVRATEDGTLLITLPAGLGSNQWVEVEPLVFREVGGQDTLVFHEDSKGRITNVFHSQYPMIACVKLAWYKTPGFHYSLLAISMILFLSTLGWPIRVLSRLLCTRKKEIPGAPWLVRVIAGGMSALYIIFLIGIFLVVSDQMELMFGVPPLLKIVLVLPIISALLTIGALFFVYVAWKNKYWSFCGRVHYTLVALASLVFLWFLAYWKLLGFHF